MCWHDGRRQRQSVGCIVFRNASCTQVAYAPYRTPTLWHCRSPHWTLPVPPKYVNKNVLSVLAQIPTEIYISGENFNSIWKYASFGIYVLNLMRNYPHNTELLPRERNIGILLRCSQPKFARPYSGIGWCPSQNMSTDFKAGILFNQNFKNFKKSKLSSSMCVLIDTWTTTDRPLMLTCFGGNQPVLNLLSDNALISGSGKGPMSFKYEKYVTTLIHFR